MAVIGTKSAMLILREAYYGTTRFDDFARRVGITKAATAARLAELVDAGLLTRQPYREPGQRVRDEYVLTEAGTDLMPVVWSMFEWGRQHLSVDSTLAYIDQGSFLGLRALGRGPLAQYAWIYERPVDFDGLRRFHHNLGRGLLGRRIERSPLPFGRDHWVAWTGPADIDVAASARPRAEALDWLDEQIRVPIDPEGGPSWRLAVQPFIEGGAVITLIASHSICDGLAITLAIKQAARGETWDLGYPQPHSRTRGEALREDAAGLVRAVPDFAKAIGAAVKLARNNRNELTSSAGRSAPAPAKIDETRLVTVPALVAYIDEAQWQQRMESLGGTSNSLFAGIAAKLGQ
ncbi:MAG: winged helix-turn-helix transcriptional regulator, partial [Mycolicibacterium aromaticivorans]|nr:winged helix-turn-helix transcriptional regulator [Mycolicibacterium aromaticivorans]